MKRILLLGFVILSLLLSCQKETDSTSERAQKLMGSVWQISGASIDPPLYSSILGNTTNDYFTYFVRDCVYDNLIRFLPNNIRQTDEADLKCASDDPQTFEDYWQLSLDEAFIQTASGDSTIFINYEIKTLTNYTLEVRYIQNFNNNDHLIEARYHAK